MCLGTIGRVTARWDEGGVPMGSVAGKDMCLLYTPEAEVGDVLLTHMGFALEVLGEDEAAAALELREELGIGGRGRASSELG